ncbi:MAG TPA: hypothetical protein VNR88_01545 [Hyphomicrobium sp.]|nr:hypothetical protein [Hyphomicrobium sp.]
MDDKRFWYPSAFTARNGRRFRVSFLIAEEATWDHRLHDLDGSEIAGELISLTRPELRSVQVSCDGIVGTQLIGSGADDARVPLQKPLQVVAV